MPYILPRDVHSPKNHWKLVEHVIDKGPGQPAYAIGTWNNERRIGFRWNGTDDNPIGNPQSRGLPTWTILDKRLHASVLALIPPAKQAFVSAYLDICLRTELRVAFHGTGRRTLEERKPGETLFNHLENTKLFANDNAADFYRAVAQELANRQAEGQLVSYQDTTPATDI